MTVLTQASNQWFTRPADERFTSLDELVLHTGAQKLASSEVVTPTSKLVVQTIDDGRLVVDDGEGHMEPSAWAFDQLSYMAAAPAPYLRTLPTAIAAQALNHGLAQRREEVGLLSRLQGDDPLSTLAAVTGPKYGRIWNDDVARALRDRFGNGIDGDFRVPGEFGKEVEVDKSNTTIYAGDRDMFVFLADEKNRIELPGRRNGELGSFARGFFVWNSEVGSRSMGIATFLFDYVCSNRMVWGAQGFEQISITHTSTAPGRFIEEIAPQLDVYSQQATTGIRAALEDARARRIDSPIDEFLRKYLTKKDSEAVMAAHLREEDRPIETLWDASVGVTAFARGITNQDSRVWYERLGGKLIELAA